MPSQDMWGDFQVQSLRVPVQLLREQAAALGLRTRNLVVTEVSTSTRRDQFRYGLELVVPALDDYRYHLLSLIHDIHMYPLVLEYDGDSELSAVEVSSEDDLNRALQKALSSEKTKRIINNLIGQASALAS